MDLSLSGRTALVTGSSGGIGSAIAGRLAAEGCSVIVHGRDRDSAERVAEQVRRAGGEASVVLGDLAIEDQAGQICAEAVAHGVDVLVNNAGPFREHDWEGAGPSAWMDAFEGNVVSGIRLIRSLIPTMRARGWGQVVNIGSRAAVTPLANMVEYSAVKAAVVNLTVSLAQHLAGSGITSNCVSPGVILTPSLQKMFTDRACGARAGWDDIEASVTADYAPKPRRAPRPTRGRRKRCRIPGQPARRLHQRRQSPRRWRHNRCNVTVVASGHLA